MRRLTMIKLITYNIIQFENQDPEIRPLGNTSSSELQGHVVESTDRFTYLGSDIHSSERSTPEILGRIGLAPNISGRLANVWK